MSIVYSKNIIRMVNKQGKILDNGKILLIEATQILLYLY